jgi:hypothetical protein
MAPFPAQSWTFPMEREIFWYGVLFLFKIPKCHDTWVDVGRRIWLGDIWQWVPALNAATRSIWSPTAHDWGEYLYHSCSGSGSGSGSGGCSCTSASSYKLPASLQELTTAGELQAALDRCPMSCQARQSSSFQPHLPNEPVTDKSVDYRP